MKQHNRKEYLEKKEVIGSEDEAFWYNISIERVTDSSIGYDRFRITARLTPECMYKIARLITEEVVPED